ncbi:MAG: leucine--tRNA ligase [Chloroflexota bacterium]
MPERYEPTAIEPKWQARWEADRLYEARPDSSREKYYALVMFPYTSGDLHIGHWYNFALADTHARYKRMRGYNVFMPFGFDSFGLPAENAAIKSGIHPHEWTISNIRRMEGQARQIGGMYDWSTELATCLPEYYRWNQWFFLQFYKRGLAYRAKAPVNWCPSCSTVLANEQVVDGRCERCETPVVRRDLEQWFFKITQYADELLKDLETIDWPERVKTMQEHWIGRSEGVEFSLEVAEHPTAKIDVFTTRVDTVFGLTYVVLAPEHPLVDELTAPEQREAVKAYQEQARRQSEIERQSTEREKTGVELGSYAINPANGERVPVWIADYVLVTYGTGAIMAVPASDERDFEFAQRFNQPIRPVVVPEGWDGQDFAEAYTAPGVMVNSEQFNGLASTEAKARIAEWFEERGIGRRTVNYRIRDWLVSRQRYWGTPIPVVYCEQDGIQPVSEDQLPILLPEDAEFRPTGESPLALHEGFVNATCPACGGPARRETDTMDTFVDSSWYFLRYVSPNHDEPPGFDQDAARYWLPVDQYMGGVEHAVMHLLYSRFFTKVLADMGLIEFREPFTRLYNQGIILGPDGLRMSKSRGNVINPDEYVQTKGADTVRGYLMFIGPWEAGGPWNPQGIGGVEKFLGRVWNLASDPATPKSGASDRSPEHPVQDAVLLRALHQTIRDVTDDFEKFRYNTMLSKLMTLTNTMSKLRDHVSADAWNQTVDGLLLMLAPSAPHLSEELWSLRGGPYSIHQQTFPAWDPELAREDSVTLPVQVNGKVRDTIEVPAEIARDEEQVKALVLELPKIKSQIDGHSVQKFIFVPGRLVGLVVR